MTRYTPAQKRAFDKYRSEKIERIEITVPTGRKELYKRAADESGKSLNRFLIDCIENAIEAHNRPQKDI